MRIGVMQQQLNSRSDNMETIKKSMIEAGWEIVKKIAYNDLIFHRTGDEIRIQTSSYSKGAKCLFRLQGYVGTEKIYSCKFGFSNPYSAGLEAIEELEKREII
jgi:hypothetical protein